MTSDGLVMAQLKNRPTVHHIGNMRQNSVKNEENLFGPSALCLHTALKMVYMLSGKAHTQVEPIQRYIMYVNGVEPELLMGE